MAPFASYQNENRPRFGRSRPASALSDIVRQVRSSHSVISSGRLLAAASAVLVVALPAPAGAQGFTQEAGEGRVIATFEYSQSDKAFNNAGNSQDIPDYEQFSVYIDGEYGLTDDLTLLLRPSFRAISQEGGSDDSGINYLGIGARYRLLNADGFVVSTEATWRIAGQKRSDNLAQAGIAGNEYDLRLQVAKGSAGGFAIVEGGYRFRNGPPPNEFHLDGTFGVNVTPKFQIIANSYNTFSDGGGSGFYKDGYRYNDIFLGGAYRLSDPLTIQLGVRGTVAGENALRQRGVFAGLWYRF